MNSEKFLESFEVSQHLFPNGWKFWIYMDRIWRWRHRPLPEKILIFLRYYRPSGTRCKKPFVDTCYQSWETFGRNSPLKKNWPKRCVDLCFLPHFSCDRFVRNLPKVEIFKSWWFFVSFFFRCGSFQCRTFQIIFPAHFNITWKQVVHYNYSNMLPPCFDTI